MKKTRIIKQFGFTIIELLLVIAIIGVMASIGVSLFHKRTENLRVQKAALQMQQLLQAGMAYYTANNSWPAAGTTKNIPAAFAPFIPMGDNYNPWAYDQNGYEFTKDGDYKFTVCTTTPSATIAAKIDALLPNAETFTTANSNQKQKVCAEVTVPGQAEQPQQTIIGGVGEASNGDNITATCPSNMCATFFFADKHIHMNSIDISSLYDRPYKIKETQIGVTANSCSLDKTTNQVTCKASVSVNDGSLSALYIAVCTKPTTPGQCSGYSLS